MNSIMWAFLIHSMTLVSASQITPINDTAMKSILDNILTDYDPKLRPNYAGPPVDVKVDATILSISNIDEVRMIYTLDMFLRQRWVDARLRHSYTENLTLIMGSKQPSDIIWVPDTVFINSVVSNMHHVMVNNHKIDINYDGSVFWGTRVTVSPSCPLNLKSYPMDRQSCSFTILSYAYTSKHINYEWFKEKESLKINNIQMAQFQLESFNTSREHISYVAGNYTELKGHFHFKRLMGFAVMQIYIPTICVVIVSWISLWVKRTVVPARVALLITTLLTISTVWGSVNAQLPRVNYVKAIDIFMMTSFGSIIFTLLEFTVVMNTDFLLRFMNLFPKKCVTCDVPSVCCNQEEMSEEIFLDDKEKGNGEVTIMVPRSEKSLPNGVNGTRHNTNEHSLRFRPYVNGGKTLTKDVESPKTPKKNTLSECDRLADSIECGARILFPLVYATFLVCYFAIFLREDHDADH